MPVPSLLSQFRTRLGVECFTRIFNDLLLQARAQGLVKDRLRLKDATHLIATSAIPSTLRLVAQTREQVLVTAEGFAASEVAAQRAQIDAMRTATVDLRNEQRLLARVTHLRGHCQLVDADTSMRQRSGSRASLSSLMQPVPCS